MKLAQSLAFAASILLWTLSAQNAHATLVTETFTSESISDGSFQYDSSTPFALYDGNVRVYLPVSDGSVTFTYHGVTTTFAITRILVAPLFPDGALGYADYLVFNFGGDMSQLELWHTPAGNLPSYALSDLNPGSFEGGFLYFSDYIDGTIVGLDEPLGPFAAVPEPGSLALLAVGVLAMATALRRRRFQPHQCQSYAACALISRSACS